MAVKPLLNIQCPPMSLEKVWQAILRQFVLSNFVGTVRAELEIMHCPCIFQEKHCEIKNEHPQEHDKIIPFLGPFRTQSCMIHAIFKRYKGRGVADVLVAAGVIAEGSVDQALRGKHYRRCPALPFSNG